MNIQRIVTDTAKKFGLQTAHEVAAALLTVEQGGTFETINAHAAEVLKRHVSISVQGIGWLVSA